MDFDQISAFRLVVRSGSFNAAARELFMTQAGVAARIKSLEREIGEDLVERDGRHLELTSTGKAFYTFAEHVYRLRRGLEFDLSHSRDTVAIGSTSTSAKYLLPALLGEVRKACPLATFSVRTMSSAQIGAELTAGTIDCGVLPQSRVPAAVKSFPLYPITLWLVGPGGSASTVRLDSSHPIPFVALNGLPENGLPETKQLAEEWADEHDFTLNVVVEEVNHDSLKEAVLHGLGLSIVAEHAIAEDVRQGRLETISAPGLPVRFWHVLAYRPPAGHRPALSTLLRTAEFGEWRTSVPSIERASPEPPV